VQLWTIFRLTSKAALNIQRAEVVQCKVVCEMHIAQLSLAVVFAKGRTPTFMLGVAIFKISGI
jgi:hypothetical protein